MWEKIFIHPKSYCTKLNLNQQENVSNPAWKRLIENKSANLKVFNKRSVLLETKKKMIKT